MASRKDGIWVPKKVIIRMIVASVFINIIFLLMGMVIGREDGRWKSRPQDEDVTGGPVEETEINDDAIDMEMSLYDRSRSQKRSKPIDVTYLDEKDASEAEPSGQKVTKNQPDPPKQKSQTTTRPDATTPGGQYVIQVVATKNANTVREVTAKLKNDGYQVFTESQGNLRRICVGYFKTESQANREKQKIDRALKVNSWVRKQ